MVAAVNTADLVAGARALIEPLTGHTPGEWEMSVTHPTNACANVRCGYTDVATLYGGDSDVPQPADDEPWGPQPIRDANARLTAAAPALRDTVAALADLADAQAQEIAELRRMLKSTVCYGCNRRIGDKQWLGFICVSCKSKREFLSRAALGDAP